MKPIGSRITLIAFLLASFAVALRGGPPAPQGDDTAAVKQLVADFDKAFNNHDVNGQVQLFTEDGDFINIRGTISNTHKAIEEHMRGTKAFDPGSTIHVETSLKKIHFLTPNIAVVDSDFVWTRTDRPESKGIYDWIMVKQNGRWLISVLHEATYPTAPAPVPNH